MKLKLLSLCAAFVLAFCCVFGAACKPNGIESIALNGLGELVITMQDGSVSTLGKIGGKDNERVEEAYVSNGSLKFKLVTGDTVDLGTIAGLTDAFIDDDGSLMIFIANKEKLFNCGKAIEGIVANDFTYKEVWEGGKVKGYSVTGLLNTTSETVYVSPTYKEKRVVGISDEAFKDCTQIESINIPDSVESIGKFAFSDCSNLVNINFGIGLKEVDNYAFARCWGLKDVNVRSIEAWCEISFADPSSNPLYFGDNLYEKGTLITELNLSDAVTKIGAYTFYEYAHIKSVATGDGAAEIGDFAFYGCTALESLKLGWGVAALGVHSFSGCGVLKDVTVGESLKTIGDFAFNMCGNIEKIVLPDSTRSIGESSFNECYSLKEISLNDGLETIGDGAFAGCPSLEKFIMPDSVKEIGHGVLMNIRGSGFGGESGDITGISEIRVSNSITEIPDYAFSMCGIKSITLGSKVRIVGYSSFFGCEALESVVIPVSVTTIQSYAFYHCSSLNTVFYEGDETKWNDVFIGKNGNDIRNAAVYFYSAEKPAAPGNFWHYVQGVPTVWE